MNAKKITQISSQTYLVFSIVSLAYVALLSLIDPQATMNLVGTTLPNTDALSSIRGIYGGVGMVIVFQLSYWLIKELPKGLLFLTFFWGAYAISRLITIFSDGPLGDFGSQWIVIETTFFLLGVILYLLTRKFGIETRN